MPKIRQRVGINLLTEKMKKIFNVILAVTMCATVVLTTSCDNEKNPPENQNPSENPEQPIKRIVKPTASFEMEVVGVNPEGYPPYSGASAVLTNFDYVVRCVNERGNDWGPLMQSRGAKIWGNWDDVEWGEYVHDNSYVGGRITCMHATIDYSDPLSETPTEAQWDHTMSYVDSYFDGTPDGPFQLKMTCTWIFRLGRDSTYTYVDENVETYKDHLELEAALRANNVDNPLAQSLFYYDAEKDEFILQDRKKTDLK